MKNVVLQVKRALGLRDQLQAQQQPVDTCRVQPEARGAVMRLGRSGERLSESGIGLVRDLHGRRPRKITAGETRAAADGEHTADKQRTQHQRTPIPIIALAPPGATVRQQTKDNCAATTTTLGRAAMVAGRDRGRCHSVIRTPADASNGAAGLRNRLSTPGPLVTAVGAIPGAPTPVGSLRMPQVAYLLLNRLLIEAKTSSFP